MTTLPTGPTTHWVLGNSGWTTTQTAPAPTSAPPTPTLFFFELFIILYNKIYDFCLLLLSFHACLILVKLGIANYTNTDGIRILTIYEY